MHDADLPKGESVVGQGTSVIRPAVPDKKAPISFSREIHPEEVAMLDPEIVPYGMLIRGYGKEGRDGQPVFQALEERDPENIGLRDYRKKEVDTIESLLKGHNIVALAAPSRAGKTEVVLYGEPPYFDENTVYRRLNAYYLDVRMLFKPEHITEQLKKFERKKATEPKGDVVILDEFLATDEAAEFAQQLLAQGYKLVVCQGGKQSNRVKEGNIRELEVKYEAFRGIPVVEMGIKPLNGLQLREMFEIHLSYIKKNPAVKDQPAITPDEEVKMRQALDRVIEIASRIPLPFHLAWDIINDYVDRKVLISPDDELVIKGKLETDNFGRIYSLEKIKQQKDQDEL